MSVNPIDIKVRAGKYDDAPGQKQIYVSRVTKS
jgi:hypothetical protein